MKLNKLLPVTLSLAIGLASSVAFAHQHTMEDKPKKTIAKLMAGANLYEEKVNFDNKSSVAEFSMANYGIGIEYEFTSTFGIELRHYFGGEEKLITHEDTSSLDHDAELEGATALLLNIQSPSVWGVSAYLQGGPSIVKNSFDTVDYTNNSFAYGAGIEVETSENTIVFIDALQFNEYDISDVNVRSVRNRMVMLGVSMRF